MMEHGIVTSVRYQDGVPVCAVRLKHRVDVEDKYVPVMRMHGSQFLVPEQDQLVQLLTLGDQRFIIGVLDRGEDDFSPPDLSEGETAFRFDDGTTLSFTKDGSGGFNVSIEASGDVNITANGDVLIEGIAFSNHTHDYSDSTINDTGDGSGSESSETKTTDPPA